MHVEPPSATENETEHTTTTLDQYGVATMCITNARALNLVNTPVLADVSAALAELGGRAEVRALVLRGSGDRAFIGGADIHEMSEFDRTSGEAFIERIRSVCEEIRCFPRPVLARIPGWCLGAGLEIAMSCDLRISSTDARYGMPEVRVGIPSVIHAALLPRLIGSGRASWMLLTGESIDASTALSWGLVHTVQEPGELDEVLTARARRFHALPEAAIRQQKELLRGWERMPVDAAIDASVPEFGAAFDTGEPARHMGRFLRGEHHD